MKRRVSLTVVVFGSLIGLLGGGIALGGQLASFSESFSVGAGGTLVVDVSGGDIEIRTGSPTVQVDVVGLDQSELKDLQVNQDGGTVYVIYKAQGRRWSSPRFELGIPSNFNLDLKTSGGDMTIAGDFSGDAEGKTSGGDIGFRNIEGNVNFKTSGGDIEGGEVRGSVELATSGGDITLAAADGKVDVKTSGGDIEVGEVGSELTARTSGGDIKLGNVGGWAQVSTAGGDIEVGGVGGSAELSTAGGDIRLNSASGPVKAKTAGGDLEVRNVEGGIDAATAGGDIHAELVGSAAQPSQLKTAGGDIELQLDTAMRATVHAVIHVSGNWEREIREVSITSDFMQVSPTLDQSRREIRAEIPVNGGGTEILAETTNGNIRVVGKRSF